MREPSIPLQIAVMALLKDVKPVRGFEMFDRVPQGQKKPYGHPSGWQVLDDGADCMDAAQINFDIQCYSGAPGRDDIGTIAGAVAAALHQRRPAIDGFSDVEIQYRGTLYFTEPDGISRRAVVSFRALMDEA